METCKWCNDSGTFLKVSKIGLCLNCDHDIVRNIRFNTGKVREALDNLEYYDSVENAIENFIEVLKYAKLLLAYEKKGIRTEDIVPSVLIDNYTEKLNWMKDLRKYGFDIHKNFYCHAADTDLSNEDGTSRQDIIGRCRAGDKLFPEIAPHGRINNAIKLMTKYNRQIGWLTQKVSCEFCKHINDDDFIIDMEISEITIEEARDYNEPLKGCYIRFTCFKR